MLKGLLKPKESVQPEIVSQIGVSVQVFARHGDGGEIDISRPQRGYLVLATRTTMIDGQQVEDEFITLSRDMTFEIDGRGACPKVRCTNAAGRVLMSLDVSGSYLTVGDTVTVAAGPATPADPARKKS